MIWYSLTGSEKRLHANQSATSAGHRDRETSSLDLLNRLDLAVLHETTELGDGHPLRLLVLARATAGAATGSATVATSTAKASTVSRGCCGCGARHALHGAQNGQRLASEVGGRSSWCAGRVVGRRFALRRALPQLSVCPPIRLPLKPGPTVDRLV